MKEEMLLREETSLLGPRRISSLERGFLLGKENRCVAKEESPVGQEESSLGREESFLG